MSPAEIAAELDRPAPAAVHAIIGRIRERHGPAIAAILFYGSCRRTGDMSGLLDLYVLHDGHRAFHRHWRPALLNRVLPPNVVQITAASHGTPIRAKVAILSRRQFARRMRDSSLDTTIWARFCQPASAPYVRDNTVHDWLQTVIGDAQRTAALWARRLASPGAAPSEAWITLFAHTYAAELRPESVGRPEQVYRADAAWFDAVLAGEPPAARDEKWSRAWRLRRLCGRTLNLLRLLKAAFTFTDGADYIAWKLARHAGTTLRLTDWQRRHPILAAPVLLWRMRRGAIPPRPPDPAGSR